MDRPAIELRRISSRVPADAAKRGAYARRELERLTSALAGHGAKVEDERELAACLELIDLPEVRDSVRLQEAAAGLAARVECTPFSSLSNTVAERVSALFKPIPGLPSPAARSALAEAATRDGAFALGNRLMFALHALPEASIATCALLRGSTFNKVGLAREMMELIVRRDDPVRCDALAAFFEGPASPYAVQLLPELAAPVARALLPGLTGAIVHGGGPLHTAAVALARVHPELRPAVDWIARSGGIGAAAESNLAPGPATDPALLAAVQAVIDDAPRDPWTPSERMTAATQTDPAAVLAFVKRAADVPCGVDGRPALSGLAHAHAVAAIARLTTPKRLSGPSALALTGIAVEGALQLQVRLALLQAVNEGARLPVTMRASFASAAHSRLDPDYQLLRLGLPGTLALWRACRLANFDDDDLLKWDQALVLSLEPDEGRPAIEAFYLDCTPNQRRALLRTAPLERVPGHLDFLLSFAADLDSAMAVAVIERVAGLSAGSPRPAFADDAERVLLRFATSDASLALRGVAARALGGLGGEGALRALSRVEDPEFAAARAAIRARLGLHEGGQLSLAASGGELALASDDDVQPANVEAPAPRPAPAHAESAPALAGRPDGRPELGRLAPPPRRLSLALRATLLLAADNGWGALWVNLLLLVMWASLAPPNKSLGDTIGGAIFFCGVIVGNHLLAAATPRLYRCLRYGSISMGRVTATLVGGGGTGRNRRAWWCYTAKYMGDDGVMRTHEVARNAKLPALGDEALEPLLVRSDAKGVPKDVIALDRLRSAKLRADGRFVMAARGWIFLALAVGPSLTLLLLRYT